MNGVENAGEESRSLLLLEKGAGGELRLLILEKSGHEAMPEDDIVGRLPHGFSKE